MTPRPATLAMRRPDFLVRAAIVALTLGTAYIHATLGGLLFLLNAAGYLVLAGAMVLPLPILIRHRTVVRLALIGFAAATIGGWLVDGPRFSLAYLAKGIEVLLIGLLIVELLRTPAGRRPLAALCLTLVAVVVAACGGGAAVSATAPPGAGVTVDAKDKAFSTTTLTVPAGTPFQLFFRNLDGQPHNVAFYTDRSASSPVFVGDTITNAATTYDVPALAAGTYFFRCDVHPDMSGTAVARNG
jgi:plastocyanin